MSTSVIVPTYRRLHTLLQTIESLCCQSSTPSEIIVVDNAAQSCVQDGIETLGSRATPRIRYIAHTYGGSSGARHRGVRESEGDLLLFTDDDVVLDRFWVEAYEKAFRKHPKMVAASGRTLPNWENVPPKWLTDYIGDKKRFAILALLDISPTIDISVDNPLFSCNMALRRDLFHRTGLRPEIFGTRTIGSGEWGLERELRSEGKSIGYIPSAIAHHMIPTSRMTVQYMRRWAWHQGGAEMFERWHNRSRTLGSLIHEAARICRRFSRVWLHCTQVWNRTDRESLDVQFEATRGLCMLTYTWWMLTDRRVKKALDTATFRILEEIN